MTYAVRRAYVVAGTPLMADAWERACLSFVHCRGNELAKFAALECRSSLGVGFSFNGLLELEKALFSGHCGYSFDERPDLPPWHQRNGSEKSKALRVSSYIG
jgi:hypothetical protein